MLIFCAKMLIFVRKCFWESVESWLVHEVQETSLDMFRMMKIEYWSRHRTVICLPPFSSTTSHVFFGSVAFKSHYSLQATAPPSSQPRIIPTNTPHRTQQVKRKKGRLPRDSTGWPSRLEQSSRQHILAAQWSGAKDLVWFTSFRLS